MAYAMDRKAKEAVLSEIIRVLDSREDIVFAYAYGSFVEGNLFFGDIDIAVFFDNNIEEGSLPALRKEVSIQRDISDSFRKAGTFIDIDAIDVRCINNAPPSFAFKVIDGGVLLVDKDYNRRTDYVERVSDECRSNYGILASIGAI